MAQTLARPVANLIEILSRLPGVGPKTASRLTFYLLREPNGLAIALAEALAALSAGTVLCERCFNVAEASPCPICADPTRDQQQICVVEEPMDVLAVERTGAFHGAYHVLHGALVAHRRYLSGEAQDRRVGGARAHDAATRGDPGDEPQPGRGKHRVLHLPAIADHRRAGYALARGLPVGGDLEYTDEVTLSRALEGRRAM